MSRYLYCVNPKHGEKIDMSMFDAFVPKSIPSKIFHLPSRQNMTEMRRSVQVIAQRVLSMRSIQAFVKCTSSTDSIMGLVQLVDQMKMRGSRILICVRQASLNKVRLNLIQSCDDLVIINSDGEVLPDELQSRPLKLPIGEEHDAAQKALLDQCGVVLAVTSSCFDICMLPCLRSKFDCGILFEAHAFTQQVSVLSLLDTVKRLILMGERCDLDM